MKVLVKSSSPERFGCPGIYRVKLLRKSSMLVFWNQSIVLLFVSIMCVIESVYRVDHSSYITRRLLSISLEAWKSLIYWTESMNGDFSSATKLENGSGDSTTYGLAYNWISTSTSALRLQSPIQLQLPIFIKYHLATDQCRAPVINSPVRCLRWLAPLICRRLYLLH